MPGPVRALIVEYPFAEPLVAVLLQALGAVGRAAEALDYHARFRRKLAEELGTDPGPEVQAVHQALLRGEYNPPRPAATPTPVPPAGRAHPRWPMTLACLAVAAASAWWIRLGAPPHDPPVLAAAAAALGLSAALAVALVPRRRRWRDRRWPVAAGTAATGALVAVLVPLTTGVDPVDPPPPGGNGSWLAHTVTDAPLFVASGQVTLTVPAHAQVRVTGPVNLPHCHAKPPHRTGP